VLFKWIQRHIKEKQIQLAKDKKTHIELMVLVEKQPSENSLYYGQWSVSYKSIEGMDM